jgi:hypothetical protein
MFLGMVGLYFLIRHLITAKKKYLLLVAFFYSLLFYTSYSSIPFIVLSQILWFYRPSEETKRPTLPPFLILNGLILFFCLPWIIFLVANYKGQITMDPFHLEGHGSFINILYSVFRDWVPHAPLMIASAVLLVLLPIFSKSRKNALVLLSIFILPIGGLYCFCKLLNVTHFVTSRYFINFLPLFFITLYLSLEAIEFKFERLKRFLRLRFLFVILFIASNLIVLPLYYRSEKQDFRGLVTYLKGHLREGDKIFVGATGDMPPILHYFGAYPKQRHHVMSFWKDSEKIIRVEKSFIYQNKILTIIYSKSCCTEYVADGSRLWIVVDKWTAKKIKESSPSVLKGYFDGSFLNFNSFPTDVSMYLFLWDPSSPNERGIDMPID